MTARWTHHAFDVLVVGGGGAGLRAALAVAQADFRVAVISKVHPLRSHTVSAQGGITAALANSGEDDWRWHMYDTVKGSDWLGDQDAIEFMCRHASDAVYELEHMGLLFSRMPDGRIYQRQFGGQTRHFGGEQAARTCAAADRTGHALLHTLYQQNLRAGTVFFDEYFALDLLTSSDGEICGVAALQLATGTWHAFSAGQTVLATGGGGRLFRHSTNAHINTGDGTGMVLRAGLPVQDMEFWQFHPTGLPGSGSLISEAVRGEGGYLVNAEGERFMSRYAPHAGDLAGRDVVARAIAMEIHAGRGLGPHADYVHLKLDHLGDQLIRERLPGIRDLAIRFAGVDPARDPVPVVPTAHYMMGGIPVSLHGEVLAQGPVDGLYAVGECACVSVHGANRLGGNSLLDLVVFGRATGQRLVETAKRLKRASDPSSASLEKVAARLDGWQKPAGGNVADLRQRLQHMVQRHCGVFRTADLLSEGLCQLTALEQELLATGLSDHSRVFNLERMEALELDNLFLLARATLVSALARTESRGAHTRDDFPARDDQNWLRHSLFRLGASQPEYKPVNLQPVEADAIPPVERTY